MSANVANQVSDWWVGRTTGLANTPAERETAREDFMQNMLGYSWDPEALNGMGAWIKDEWTRPYSGAYAFGRSYDYGYGGGGFPSQYSRGADAMLHNWNIRIT
jgi:hypothetical protein